MTTEPREAASLSQAWRQLRPRTKVLVLAVPIALAAVLFAGAWVLVGRDDPPAALTSTESVPEEGFAGSDLSPAQATVDRALVALDQDQIGAMIRQIMGTSGRSRCFAGFSADFPDLVLVTTIHTSGLWVQVNVDAEKDEVVLGSLEQGEDYRAAGIDPSRFADSSFECRVSREGGIYRVG